MNENEPTLASPDNAEPQPDEQGEAPRRPVPPVHHRRHDADADAATSHNRDAEDGVLGSILLDNGALELATGIGLCAGDFHLEVNRRVFLAMLALREQGVPIDTATVATHLHDDSAAQTIDGGLVHYLIGLSNAVPSAIAVTHFAPIVLEHSTRRELSRLGSELARKAADPDIDLTEYRRGWEQRFDDISARSGERRVRNIRATLEDMWKPVGELGWFDADPPRTKLLLQTQGDPHTGIGSQGYMPLGKVGMLAAAGGVGKTMALIQLGVAITTGGMWLGSYETVTEGRAVLLLGEEDEAEAWRRVRNVVDSLGDQLTDEQRKLLADRLVVLPLMGQQLALMARETKFSRPRATLFAQRLREKLHRADGLKLIVLDPASRFMGPDIELDNQLATQWVAELEALAIETGATLLISHHMNKGGVKEARTDQTAARGSSALTDAVRWQANIDGVPGIPGRKVLRLVKANHVPHSPDVDLVAGDWGVLRRMTDHELQVEAAETGKTGKATRTDPLAERFGGKLV